MQMTDEERNSLLGTLEALTELVKKDKKEEEAKANGNVVPLTDLSIIISYSHAGDEFLKNGKDESFDSFNIHIDNANNLVKRIEGIEAFKGKTVKEIRVKRTDSNKGKEIKIDENVGQPILEYGKDGLRGTFRFAREQLLAGLPLLAHVNNKINFLDIPRVSKALNDLEWELVFY